MSSLDYISKITLFHQAGILHYFMRKMHDQITLKFDKCIVSIILNLKSTDVFSWTWICVAFFFPVFHHLRRVCDFMYVFVCNPSEHFFSKNM